MGLYIILSTMTSLKLVVLACLLSACVFAQEEVKEDAKPTEEGTPELDGKFFLGGFGRRPFGYGGYGYRPFGYGGYGGYRRFGLFGRDGEVATEGTSEESEVTAPKVKRATDDDSAVIFTKTEGPKGTEGVNGESDKELDGKFFFGGYGRPFGYGGYGYRPFGYGGYGGYG